LADALDAGSVRERAPLSKGMLYGVFCGLRYQTKMLITELHDESRMNFTLDVLTLNFGLRHEFTENYIMIVSMGHELGRRDQPTAYRLFRYPVGLLTTSMRFEAGFWGGSD